MVNSFDDEVWRRWKARDTDTQQIAEDLRCEQADVERALHRMLDRQFDERQRARRRAQFDDGHGLTPAI
jgi:DNA-binding MarR family transcriptional regulator